MQAQRDAWRAGQPALDPDRLVFVDETWASTNMLWDFLGQALDAFAPAECRNYFRHCGYNATPTSKAH